MVLYQNNNEKRLKYPDLFLSQAPAIESPLYWNTDAVKLKEILTALELEGVIAGKGGAEIPFTTIVSSFEQLLHIPLGDSREVKRGILGRTEQPTAFLDSLATRIRKNLKR